MKSTDLIIVGSGMAGLTAALIAHEGGASPLVLERSDLLGGTAAYSGGQVWVPGNHVARRQGSDDDVATGLAYVLDIARDQTELLDANLARRWVEQASRVARLLEELDAITWDVIPGYPDYYFPQAQGSQPWGRYMTPAPFQGERLGDLRPHLQPAPHFPSGVTYGEMFAWGGVSSRTSWDYELLEQRRRDDVLTFGHAVAGGLLAAAHARGIAMLRSTAVVELLVDGEAVVGARCRDADGMERTIRGPVLLASGGYDWNTELAADLDGVPWEHGGSVAPTSLGGAALALGQAVGADQVRFPPALAPRLPGYVRPGADRSPATYHNCYEHCLPHTFIVNRMGERFCDDSFHRSVVKAAVDPANLPMFMIWDEQHHRRYGLGASMPGEPYPAGLVTSASSLPELGEALGIDGVALERTAKRFNEHAADGTDPDHGRGSNRSVQLFRGDRNHQPNHNIGPVAEAPFHGMPLRLLSTGIATTGLRTTGDAQVQRPNGGVIPGLYAAGGAAAMTCSGSGYNSGYSLSQAMTFGALAAEHVLG
jgi:3-oxosteroid 1-dehydrogenase